MSWTVLITWFFSSLGMWKILQKYEKATWQAFVPGLRYYRLGQACGRDKEGLYCLVFEVICRLLAAAAKLLPAESKPGFILNLIALVCAIVLAVFEIRVIAGLCQSFELKKRWIVLWVLAASVASMIIGFSKRFQPVHAAAEADEEVLAGTQPAELSTPVAESESGEGLVVHVRARTVRSYGKTRYLLKDVHLTIPNGSLVLLLGGSGAGKTTYLNAINGYEKADAEVMLNGSNLYTQYKKMQYEVGFVPQTEMMRGKDTVLYTLLDAAKLRLPKEVTPAQRRERVNEVMEIFGLLPVQNTLVEKLSGGQKKRLSISMEFISNPSLFILDEPDSGLDGVMARELFEQLRKIADTGKIVIVITHTPDRVIDLFDDVIVLAKDSARTGRLAFYGSIEDARKFFRKDRMEEIVKSVNRKEEGGDGLADEFVMKYAEVQHV